MKQALSFEVQIAVFIWRCELSCSTSTPHQKSVIKQWLDTVNSHKSCHTENFCTITKAK